MKKVLILLLCLNAGILLGQRKPKIKGNKDVVEVREELPPYHSVELKDDLEILLQKTSSPGYTITADDNLIDILKFRVTDSVLTISSFYTITGKKQLDITVGHQGLRSISLSDGKVFTKAMISSDEFTFKASGTSRAELQLSAPLITLQMADQSKAQLNIDADSMAVEMRHKSDADIYAVAQVQTYDLREDALANLEGSADTLMVKVSEKSKFRGERMQAQDVDLECTDNVTSRVFATRRFKLTSSGSSKTYLYGDPVIDVESFLDSSELLKRKE